MKIAAKDTTVNTAADLFSLPGTPNGLEVSTLGFSTEGVGAGKYRFDATASDTVDGGTVLPGLGGVLSFTSPAGTFDGTAGTGRWLLIGTTVDVTQFGAVGDGVTNDWLAFKLWSLSSATMGRLVTSPLTYAIQPPVWDGANTLLGVEGDTTVDLQDATIQLTTTTGTGAYIVFRTAGDNVTIRDGTIIGERTATPVEEVGTAIYLYDASNVRIENMKLSDCKNDNIYISGSDGVGSSNVVVRDCVLDNAGRNNLSAPNVTHLWIKNSGFTNANGTAPEEGIDLEPNANEECKDVTVENCYFSGNIGGGVVARSGAGGRNGGVAATRRITITGCDISNQLTNQAIAVSTVDDFEISNCVGAPGAALNVITIESAYKGKVDNCQAGSMYVAGAKNIDITHCYLDASGGTGDGLIVQSLDGEGCVDIRILHNEITGAGANGMELSFLLHSRINHNTVRNSGEYGMDVSQCLGIQLIGNRVEHSGDASTYTNILLSSVYDSEIAHNVCRFAAYLIENEITGTPTDTVFTVRGLPPNLEDIYTGKLIEVNGEDRNIDSVDDTEITLTVALTAAPIAGDTFLIHDTTKTYRGMRISSNCHNNWVHHNDLRWSGRSLNLWDLAGAQNTVEDNLTT